MYIVDFLAYFLRDFFDRAITRARLGPSNKDF
jgi:hypothetical protein